MIFDTKTNIEDGGLQGVLVTSAKKEIARVLFFALHNHKKYCGSDV